MAALKKLPWRSLCLLLLAYIVFGETLLSNTQSWIVFGGAILWGFIMAILMLSPLTGLQLLLTRWFKSDTVAFCALLTIAALASIVFNWFNLFLPVIMLLATEALARIDIQTAEFSQAQALFILTITAWLGLGLAYGATYMVSHFAH